MVLLLLSAFGIRSSLPIHTSSETARDSATNRGPVESLPSVGQPVSSTNLDDLAMYGHSMNKDRTEENTQAVPSCVTNATSKSEMAKWKVSEISKVDPFHCTPKLILRRSPSITSKS